MCQIGCTYLEQLWLTHLNRSIASNKYSLGLKNPVSLIVGNVVLLPQEAKCINPCVCANNGAICKSFLFPVLSTVRLVLEVPLWTFVSLDVVLAAARVSPRRFRVVKTLQERQRNAVQVFAILPICYVVQTTHFKTKTLGVVYRIYSAHKSHCHNNKHC